MWNGTCLSNCPSGTYSIISNGVNSCQVCTSSCLSCVSNTSCSNCAPGTLLIYLNTSTSSSVTQNTSMCVASCPLATYPDNGQCLSCPSPCNQCSLNNGQILCLTCVSGYYLLNGKCSTTCPSGYYQSASTQTCIACLSNCLTCNNSTGCLTCANSIYTAPSCTGNCSSGLYWSTTTNSCVSCYSTCATCYGGSSNQCSSCKNVSGVAYYLYGSQCLSVCPTGYYSTGLFCYQCTVANCQTCLNGNTVANCSNCTTGYILVYSSTSNSICTSTCQ
jgi:proprotein convertase subtilisin/kexin type 5